VIKGGVLDGKSLTPDEIRKLADLESREVLLAKLAGAMKASLSGAVALFAAPLSQTARLVEALRQKAEQDPSVLRGGAGTPAPAAEVAEATGEVEAAAETESDAEETEAQVVEAVADEAPAADAADAPEAANSAESGETTEG